MIGVERKRDRRIAGQHRPEPLFDVGGQAFEPVEVDHRSVKSADAAADGYGLMERGDVAESNDRPRVGGDGAVVDAIEDAHGAVASAGKEEGVDIIRPQVMVQLFEAFVIITGQVAAVVMIDVASDGDAKPARLQRPDAGFDARHLGGR